MTRTRHFQILLIVASQLALGGQLALAQAVDVQYQRKADMLHPLAGILLPPAALAGGDGTFRIGVLGQDPFNGRAVAGNAVNFLDEMVRAKRDFKGLRIVIQRFSSAKDYRPCQVVFISALSAADSVERTAEERLAALLKLKHERPLLVVGDSAGLAEKGAALRFFVFRDATGIEKVSFELNPNAAKRSGLQVSPGLLRLAGKIVPDRA